MLIFGLDGNEFTVTVVAADVAGHPFPSVIVTVLLADALTVIDLVVCPEDHK